MILAYRPKKSRGVTEVRVGSSTVRLSPPCSTTRETRAGDAKTTDTIEFCCKWAFSTDMPEEVCLNIAFAKYFYSTLNHGTPLYNWCEERGQDPGALETSGDRQHLWTPVAAVRCLRDMILLENGAQARSLPINCWAVEQIHNGAIGKISKVEVSNFLSPRERKTPATLKPCPAGLDWDRWTDQARLYPCDADLLGSTDAWGLYHYFDRGGSTWGMTGFGIAHHRPFPPRPTTEDVVGAAVRGIRPDGKIVSEFAASRRPLVNDLWL